MARREWTRPCSVCRCIITNTNQGTVHVRCSECGRACVAEAKATGAPDVPSPTAAMGHSAPIDDALVGKVRAALAKGVTSHSDLANTFDVSPKRIDAALAALGRSGVKVVIHDKEGEPARLFIDRDAAQPKKLHINAEKHFSGYRFDFGAVSDTHLGSKFYREEVLEAIYDNFAAHGIRHVFHGGNYIEGEKHEKSTLVAHGMTGQVDYFCRKYPKREGMTTYFVAGDDHEGWYQQREGIDIGEYTQLRAEAAGRSDLFNLGYMESDVAVSIPNGKKVKIRVMHAGGGSAYAISYTAQKLIESLEGGEKPQVILIGHYHKTEYLFYRNVHSLQLGTTKSQDTFMRKKRLAAHVGGWRCSMLIDENGSIVEFTPTLLPFFNQGYYESLAIDAESDAVTRGAANPTYTVVR